MRKEGKYVPGEDVPVAFGYKMGWLAIRSTDWDPIIDALGLSGAREASWEEGIETVYEDGDKYLFLTPPIDGWTLVVGNWTGGAGGQGIEGAEALICKLSARFGEAQAFSTHRVVEYHHWMLARDGKLLRSFAYLGDSGEVLSDKGEPTPVEKSLNINLDIPADYDPFSGEADKYNIPNERSVMTVAGAWSINPSVLDERTGLLGPGILATAPWA